MLLANLALPAFVPHSLLTLMGISIIAAIEGWFLRRALKLTYAESYGHAVAANWKSTIVGIPFAWLLYMAGLVPIGFGLELLGVKIHPAVGATIMQSGVFMYISSEWTGVATATAWLMLLIPFWFGSVWIERRTIMKRLPESDPAKVSKAVILGNLASYSIFIVLGVIGLVSALEDLPNQKAKFEKAREHQKQQRLEQNAETPIQNGK